MMVPHPVDAFKHSDTKGEAPHIHRITFRLLSLGHSHTLTLGTGARGASDALVAVFSHNLQHDSIKRDSQKRWIKHSRLHRRRTLQYLATHG